MRTRAAVALILFAALGCQASAVDAVGPVKAPTPPAVPPAVRLVLTPDPSLSHGAEGRSATVNVRAYAASGQPVSAAGIVAQVADTSVAAISIVAPVPSAYVDMIVYVALRKAGSSFIRVRLGNVVDSVAFTVEPVLSDKAPLIIDRFAIVEWRPKCAWACPYLAYSPVLQVHAPPGEGTATVLSVEVFFEDQPFGSCTGNVPVRDGAPMDLFVINEYLWANDIIRVQLDGKPLPDAPVAAQLLVRDALGTYRTMQITGSIERGATVETVAGLVAWSPFGC